MTEIDKNTIVHREGAKEYIKDYWTKRSPEFIKLRREELHSAKFTLWQQEITRHFPPGQRLRVLDVGCGAGFYAILLAQLGHRVTGIDLTESMVADAQALAAEAGCNADFQVMDAEQLAFPDGSFDAVVSRNVTWNLPHPDLAYAEWLRVLRPGGILLNYDAEYGKHHHDSFEKEAVYSHKDVTPALVDQCHHIYHMLDVSLYDRPAWDLSVLRQLGVTRCEADPTVWKRLYPDKDQFYIPAPLFGVWAVKKRADCRSAALE